VGEKREALKEGGRDRQFVINSADFLKKHRFRIRKCTLPKNEGVRRSEQGGREESVEFMARSDVMEH